MPTHQPVGFVSRQDWVQPIEQQLNDRRLTKPVDMAALGLQGFNAAVAAAFRKTSIDH